MIKIKKSERGFSFKQIEWWVLFSKQKETYRSFKKKKREYVFEISHFLLVYCNINNYIGIKKITYELIINNIQIAITL